MLQSLCFLAAQQIEAGQQFNDCSISHLLEVIPVPDFPSQLDYLPLLCVLKRAPTDPASCTCQLVLNIDDLRIAECTFDIHFGATLRSRYRIELTALTLPKAGTLELRLMAFEQLLAIYEISLVHQATEVL